MGKGKKKGWKSLPRDADENLHDVNLKRQIGELPDEEVFFEDTTALPPEADDKEAPELTFKQKAALNHKLYKAALKDEDVDMKDFEAKASRFNNIATDFKKVKSKPSKASMYDLWEEEEKPDASTSNGFEAEGIQFYKKTLKKIRREAPKATRFLPNITPVVEIPNEGASYNPTLESYVDYANEIAREELKMERDEKRIANNVPSKIVDYIDPSSEFEDFKALLNKNTDEDEKDGDEPSSTNTPFKLKTKPKTVKKKKRELLRKMQMLKKKEETMSKKQLQQFNNLKKTLQELRKEEDENRAKLAARKQKKVLDALTKRKKLGRGEFKDYEQPILLTDELTGSLRQLPVRGSIIEERFKSLQKRNILPIAGKRKKSNRKTSLKVKFVEKRSAKEVKKGSRVI